MIVRFTRPEIRNPLSAHVVDALAQMLAKADESVSAVVFTGSDGVFASGADLREIAELDGATAAEFARLGQSLMNTITNLEARSIAAINGYCYGGALDLALACDSRIATQTAEFCHPGAGLGIMTGWGGTQRLPRLIGEAAAVEMFLTGKRVTAEEALHTGLIGSIVGDPVAAAIDPYL